MQSLVEELKLARLGGVAEEHAAHDLILRQLEPALLEPFVADQPRPTPTLLQPTCKVGERKKESDKGKVNTLGRRKRRYWGHPAGPAGTMETKSTWGRGLRAHSTGGAGKNAAPLRWVTTKREGRGVMLEGYKLAGVDECALRPPSHLLA